MSWIIITTIAMAALLLLNSAVLMWRRRGQVAKPAVSLRKPLTPSNLALQAVFVLAILAGLVARTVAPGSGLALWIAAHGLPVYIGVCMVWMVVLGVALRLLGKWSEKRGQ